jgi:hypothetical protein
MIRIRPEQMAVFDRAAAESFESRAVAHFREILPQFADDFTDEELKEQLQSCAKRAAGHGLITERDILLFMDVSLILHDERFEENPDHPWALAILGNLA